MDEVSEVPSLEPRRLNVLDSVIPGAPPLSPELLAQLREGDFRVQINIFYTGSVTSVVAEDSSEVKVGGDSFSNIGAGATIINKSTLINSLNTVKESYGPDVAQALQQLSELVEKSGNEDAADNFNALTQELQQSQPKKSLLKSFWNGIREAIPTAIQAADLAAKIAPLFA